MHTYMPIYKVTIITEYILTQDIMCIHHCIGNQLTVVYCILLGLYVLLEYFVFNFSYFQKCYFSSVRVAICMSKFDVCIKIHWQKKLSAFYQSKRLCVQILRSVNTVL